MTDSLVAAVTDLYALPLGDFTQERNRRAADAAAQGDKQLADRIRSLRKPSASAWVVNMLARHRSDEIGQLLELGASLREAQEDLDADELRDLGKQRHKLAAAVARDGAALAEELGNPVSEAVVTEVGQTLQAALGGLEAAEAVRDGLLTRALSPSGWGPSDFADSVAVPPEGRTEARVTDITERQLAKARRNLEAAERQLEQTQADRDKASAKLVEVRPRRQKLVAELDELKLRMAELEDDISVVDRQADTFTRAVEKAAGAIEEAEENVAEAQERLDQLS